PEIDGLRAIAVIAVILNHLNKSWLPGGFLGVDVFFVISGYVIMASIAGRRDQPLGPFLREFYRRRVQRLTPALLTCVAITALVTCWFVPEPGSSLITGAASLFGVSNLYLLSEATNYFGTEASLNPFTQTWSLSIEEQFYLLFPILAWWLLQRRHHRGNVALPIAVLGGLFLLSLQQFLQIISTDPTKAYFLTTARMWELLAGALVFQLRTAASGSRLCSLPAVAPIVVLVPGLAMHADLAAISTPITVLATALLLPALETPGAIKTVLLHPGLRHIGLISYSLYLWHWSVICLGRWTVGLEGWWMPVLLVLMVVLAEASYRWIEAPLRHQSWARTTRGTLLRAGVVSSTLAGLLLWLGQDGRAKPLYAGTPTLTVTEALRSQAITGSKISRSTCHQVITAELSPETFKQRAETCTAQAAPRATNPLQPTLFVAGDSHASALMPLEGQMLRKGWSIAHMSMDGCLFPATAYGHRISSCSRFQSQWANWILQRAQPGDAVLVGGYWLSHLGENVGNTRDDLLNPTGDVTTDGNTKVKLFSDALNLFASQANAQGVQVVVLGAGPRVSNRERCLPEWFRTKGSLKKCERAFQKQLMNAAQLNHDLTQQLSPSITLLNPIPSLCAQSCSLKEMRTTLFDSDHLSPQSARALEASLLNALEKNRSQDAKEVTTP
ncbi:MAG: acyltransferase family protein, partial [Synechococcus sp.]|nr:acyltransferase family protein [Synechococcus sp.]